MSENILNESILNFGKEKGIENAGFGLRLMAWLIDVIIITVIQSLFLNPLFISIGLLPDISNEAKHLMDLATSSDPEVREELLEAYTTFIKSHFLPMFLVDMAVQGAYFIFMESSAQQGTIGKIAVGIAVTDINGQQLTPFRAAARFFSKYVSKFTFYIGFLFPLFTSKKQALHDLLAGTLVVKKKRETK